MREPASRPAVAGAVTALFRLVGIVALALACVPQQALSAGGEAGQRYIESLPQGQTYRLYVVGDSFASELGDGLKWALRDRKNVVVGKRTKAATGLVRDDTYDWQRVIGDLLAEEKIHIIVIAIGGNDRQDMRVDGKRFERFSEPWKAEYLRRVDKLATKLSQSSAAVYWVGLPNVRSSQMTRDYGRFNAYFSEAARKHGIRFVGVDKLFAGSDGAFAAYGKGLDGETHRVRDGDGIHLTNVGAHKLGEFVARSIRADLRQAAAGRSDN